MPKTKLRVGYAASAYDAVPFDKIRAAVTTVLAGGVERVTLPTKIWTSFMFLAVGFDRFRRRIGLGPKPEEPASA